MFKTIYFEREEVPFPIEELLFEGAAGDLDEQGVEVEQDCLQFLDELFLFFVTIINSPFLRFMKKNILNNRERDIRFHTERTLFLFLRDHRT